jgi:small subunit ribosomal protein S20
LPTKDSAAKRHRQSEKRRLHNKIIRSRIKTHSKIFLDAIKSESSDESEKEYRELSSLLDKAVSKGVFHRNTAARKKSRMYRLLTKSD